MGVYPDIFHLSYIGVLSDGGLLAASASTFLVVFNKTLLCACFACFLAQETMLFRCTSICPVNSCLPYFCEKVTTYEAEANDLRNEGRERDGQLLTISKNFQAAAGALKRTQETAGILRKAGSSFSWHRFYGVANLFTFFRACRIHERA